MNHILFSNKLNSTYNIAILIKESSFNKEKIENTYIKPTLSTCAVEDYIAFDLEYLNGKAPVKLIKKCLGHLLKVLDSLKVSTILCCDSNYFKVLTNQRKADVHYGSILPCAIKGYEHFNVILSLNYSSLFYNPAQQSKIDLSLSTLLSSISNTFMPLGTGIIHSEAYPDSLLSIATQLARLHSFDTLTVDIEAFSLEFHNSGIATIAFAWDKHNGIAFCVDYLDSKQIDNKPVKELLAKFFKEYKGKCIYHNATFDITVLVYELYMQSLSDYSGMLEGIKILTKNIEDTKIITYLATNTCAGNKLDLKSLSHEYLGNYAQEDINDIRLIPKESLLRYNLMDCLGTYYIYDKYLPLMIQDKQDIVYSEVMKPSINIVLQMQLNGMCLDTDKVAKARNELELIRTNTTNTISSSNIIKEFTIHLTKLAYEEDYLSRVSKAKHPDKIKYKDFNTFKEIPFNPNSGKQLQELLFNFIGLKSNDKTSTGQDATGGKVIEKLVNKLSKDDTDIITLLNALVDLGKVTKILDTFIKAFEEKTIKKDDGYWYLHGNFNISAVKSGRMSSSNINYQQIPSNSTYAKLIKECFVAPKDSLMVGADFNSMESVVNALITRDTNKLRPLIENIDSHSFNSYSYWKDKFKHLTNTAKDINRIKKEYPKDRQESKAITFALTYMGTWKTLVNNSGFTVNEAVSIENNYHELYKESDKWLEANLSKATSTGYVVGAFGLRLRTPILKQTLLNTKTTPTEASSEARTAGNMLSGQSYGLLNNRAAIEFMDRVYNSKYRLDIKLVLTVHDSIYLYVTNNIDIISWVNKNLIECMEWSELAELKHEKVSLGAELDIFKGSWVEPITIPNRASTDEILNICNRKD